ncbi:MAG: hypothetical protein U0350_47485 [Caldilineaceae bacterium]
MVFYTRAVVFTVSLASGVPIARRLRLSAPWMRAAQQAAPY